MAISAPAASRSHSGTARIRHGSQAPLRERRRGRRSNERSRSGVTPRHAPWRRAAMDLMAAAEKLWPEIEGVFRSLGRGPSTLKEGLRYRGAFYLLAGLAVENFAKALIAQKNPSQNESAADLDILALGRGHHLARVVRDAGLHLTGTEA